MSNICIYIKLDHYLAQWFIHDNGGELPVSLTRGSIESKILEVYLSKRPSNVCPDLDNNGKVGILIPTFRHRPAEVYNHLPKHAMAALVTTIRNRFDVALWNDLHHFGQIGRRQDEIIYAWMEKNGIEITEANWNAIAKRYQRQRDLYLNRQRSKNIYESKKNDLL